MFSRILHLCFLSIITLGFLLPNIARAQNETKWDKLTGEFLDPDNWTNGVPATGSGIDNAQFVQDDAYDVQLGSTHNAGASFLFLDGSVSLVGGGELIAQAVDQEEDGLLTITDSTTFQTGQHSLFDQTALFINDNSQKITNGNFRMIDDAELHLDQSTMHVAGSLGLFTDSIATIDDGSMLTSGSGRVGSGVTSISGALNSNTTLRIRSSSVWSASGIIEVGTIFTNSASSDDFMAIQSSSIVASQDFSIGKYIGSGTTISAAGAMNLHGELDVNDGSLEVTGWLVVGEDGNGTLDVFNVGEVTASNMTIGEGEHSTGTVNINSSGKLNATNLFVGDDGVGNMNIDAATANITSLLIGVGDGSGTVTAANASINVDDLQIGDSTGDGTLRLLTNASVHSGPLPFVGPNGTLEIENGQFLHTSANGSLTVEGTLLTSGATATLEDETELMPSSSVEAAAGTTTFDILRYNGDEFCIPPGGTVVVTSLFTGTSSFSGTGGVEFEGQVGLGGLGQSHASVSGRHLTLQDSSYFIVSIAGPTAGTDHDRLIATDSVTINGAFLGPSIAPEVELDPGAEIEIIRLNGTDPINGTFENLAEGDFIKHPNGIEFQISYVGGDGNDVVLTVLENDVVLLGDVNLDGAVNLLDVAPFVDRIATGVFQAEADCNEDGVVDLLDVGVFVDLISG